MGFGIVVENLEHGFRVMEEQKSAMSFNQREL